MSEGQGDRLARGAVRASFGPLNVSQEKWDAVFGTKEPETYEGPVEPKKADTYVRTDAR